MEAILGFSVLLSPLVLFYALYVYNHTVRLEQDFLEEQNNLISYIHRADSIFRNITAQLDISSKFESGVLSNITNIREGDISGLRQVSNALTRALVRVESYPDIDSIDMRRDFQSQIQEIENQLQLSVERSNRAANEYNSFVLSFPAIIFCRLFKKRQISYTKN